MIKTKTLDIVIKDLKETDWTSKIYNSKYSESIKNKLNYTLAPIYINEYSDEELIYLCATMNAFLNNYDFINDNLKYFSEESIISIFLMYEKFIDIYNKNNKRTASLNFNDTLESDYKNLKSKYNEFIKLWDSLNSDILNFSEKYSHNFDNKPFDRYIELQITPQMLNFLDSSRSNSDAISSNNTSIHSKVKDSFIKLFNSEDSFIERTLQNNYLKQPKEFSQKTNLEKYSKNGEINTDRNKYLYWFIVKTLHKINKSTEVKLPKKNIPTKFTNLIILEQNKILENTGGTKFFDEFTEELDNSAILRKLSQ